MSLSRLPDEMVMKILEYCMKSEYGYQKDYMHLAMTCKRFLHLAQNKYHTFNRFWPGRWEDMALNTCILYIPEYRRPDRFGQCPLHRQHASPNKCFYQELAPVLFFKHIMFTGLRIEVDLEANNCLFASESSRYDRIIELDLIMIAMEMHTFASLLLKLKNVKSMKLNQILFTNDLRAKIPVVERTLEFLRVRYTLCYSRECDPLLHPNIRLSAKSVAVGLLECALPQIMHYLQRFQDKINCFLFSKEKNTDWNELLSEYKLENLPFEMLADFDD